MNAIMDQTAEFDQHAFAAEQKGLHDFESSAFNRSPGPDQPQITKMFSWSNRDFDQYCPVSSPLNEW